MVIKGHLKRWVILAALFGLFALLVANMSWWEAVLRSLFPDESRVLHPRASLLVLGDAAVSYGELHHRARRLARRLVALDVGPEQFVGLAFELHQQVHRVARTRPSIEQVPDDDEVGGAARPGKLRIDDIGLL